MLSETMKPQDHEKWHEYAKRLKLPDDEGTREFFRQVVFDHFNAFNQHFPDFSLDDYEPHIEYFTAKQADADIKFLENVIMDDYVNEFNDFFEKRKNPEPDGVYQRMVQNLTPPFPPVLICSKYLPILKNYGAPYQLIEGCHRVSYLRRMLSRGLITPESSHKFVVFRLKFRGITGEIVMNSEFAKNPSFDKLPKANVGDMVHLKVKAFEESFDICVRGFVTSVSPEIIKANVSAIFNDVDGKQITGGEPFDKYVNKPVEFSPNCIQAIKAKPHKE
ncbi:hypothetical protein [Rhodanobacter terrae]|uniref:Uncharacterized protein n=1 Tax=Rhodanobacter terrae TaxID=418647 RepID=A0ABW0T160_9GAMM